MERAEYNRCRSWVLVAHKRERNALSYVRGTPRLTATCLATEYREHANSAWLDAVIALLRALSA